MEYWTAFTIGILGSIHCIGMCGPIAMALPHQSGTKTGILYNGILYNGGRIAGYSLIGLFLGLLGQGLSIAGFQKILSLILGIALLVGVIYAWGLLPWLRQIRLTPYWHQWATKTLTNLLRDPTKKTYSFIGFANAFLPCGLVYVALGGALVQSHFISGTLFMTFFGLGTLPAMLFVALSGQIFSLRFRHQLRKITPLVMLFFAVFFIVRGLEVDLPPNLQYWLDMGAAPICH